MSVRLICFDLDGTFLDDGKNIPPENMRALERAAEKGVWIVPATGRIVPGLPEALRTPPFLRWYITSNGAYVYDAKEDRVAVKAEIDLERALEFYACADTLGVLYDCYQNDWGYMTDWMLEEAARVIPDPGIRRLITTLRSPVPELKDYLRQKGEPLQKMQLYFTDPALRLRALEELPARFPDLRFTSSVPFNIEINAAGATKGQAMLGLCRVLGLELGEVLALGDGTNDLDMITAAGLGVAMANADPALIAAADYVTGSNNEGGFAAAIERFVLNG